ncbi:MAG: metal ABC transporter permease [Bacteroidia bacterium]
MDSFWIMLTGSLVAVTCGLLGCFLILRRMAMVGDAISHAVLPGIVIAFFISGSRTSLPMLVGAAAVGLLTTWLIEVFNKKARLQKDASIGLTFTSLFAIGVILISAFGGNVDLDQDCVLYGEIAYVPLDLWITGSGISLGPAPVWILGLVFLLVVLMIVAGYKGLYLTTFDEQYAAALGISTAFWHYLLMSAVSLTTVVSFESVGAILVVALLIAPAVTAYMLTDDFRKMLFISALAGIVSAVGGYYLAVSINGSIAGAMATVAGFLFALALLFAPHRGILYKYMQKPSGPATVPG